MTAGQDQAAGTTGDLYEQFGFRPGDKIGFGERPGVVVVDFQLAFTDARFKLGGRPLVERAVGNTAELLKAARLANVPVATCYTAYTSERDAPYWKIPTVIEEFHHGDPCTELDPRIYDADYDAIFCKTGPSIFFQTAAIQFLVKERVDTVFVAGCNTSGCIRATVIDAFSYGFKVMVPEPCVGDADEGPHNDNLRDVGRRYCDIVTLEESIDYLNEIRTRNDR
jgi:maleamate amidohydrolase